MAEYHLYRFKRPLDLRAGWVLTVEFETQNRLVAYGFLGIGDVMFNQMDAEPGKEHPFGVTPDQKAILAEADEHEELPSPNEIGTSNELDFHYRKAIGNPLTVFDLIEAKRLALQPDRMPQYDGATYMARVIQHAANTGRLDNFMSALARLCCRDDETIVMTQDTPFGSFFWQSWSRDEFQKCYDDYRAGGMWVMPNRNFYHGGLIGHRFYVDGTATPIMDWSVHT